MVKSDKINKFSSFPAVIAEPAPVRSLHKTHAYGFRTARAGHVILPQAGNQYILKKKMHTQMQIINSMGTFNTNSRTDEEKPVKMSQFGRMLLEGYVS